MSGAIRADHDFHLKLSSGDDYREEPRIDYRREF
jgi:hypothetical protein